MQTLTLVKPDDFHLHLRDGGCMAAVVNHSAAVFARAMIMPNLDPPVINCEQAHAYRNRILSALSEAAAFTPLMTLYLTDNTPGDEIKKLADSEHIQAVKYYPAGATTNSDSAVTDLEKVYPVLEMMQKYKVPLLMHGEVTDPEIDIFDREAVFIDRIAAPLTRRCPELKLVLEHISTKHAVDFIRAAPANVAATITPQHLVLNRNDLFRGGMRPHHYCLPVLKSEKDRRAVVAAATSGAGKFFLGTDSAPHPASAKESAHCCAGIYSAPAALSLYAEVFETENKLENLGKFAAKNGADFYGLPHNKETITLRKHEWTVPDSYPFGAEKIIPLRAGEPCQWMPEQ